MEEEKSIYSLAVVDDQQLFRKGMIGLLEEFPEYKVIIEAENGKDLLDALEKEIPQIVLLDLEMPVMDGIATTIALRKKYPDIKIIIITMHDDDSFISHLIDKGAHGFLLKDTGIEEVVEAIQSVSKTGFYFNERVSKAMVSGLVRNNKIIPSFAPVSLSPREIEVIEFICRELTAKEIAEKMSLSVRTIEAYRDTILHKIKARNTVGIVMYAVKHNLVAGSF